MNETPKKCGQRFPHRCQQDKRQALLQQNSMKGTKQMEASIRDHIFYNDREYEVAKIVNKAGKRMLMCAPVAGIMNSVGAHCGVPQIMCSMMCIPSESVRPATRQAMR